MDPYPGTLFPYKTHGGPLRYTWGEARDGLWSGILGVMVAGCPGGSVPLRIVDLFTGHMYQLGCILLGGFRVLGVNVSHII